eukprot:216130-Pyramimonas_sp.AAC.1
MACIVMMIEKRIEEQRHHVCLSGFRSGRQTSEITSVAKRLSQDSAVWGKGDSLWLADLDILQASDNVTPCLAMRCLRALGISSDLIVALIEPMIDNQCVASFEGIEACSALRWDKSIRTGGVEGP